MILDWKHGYFADAGYTYGYYPETMPRRMHWAALLQDHETPLKGFRYLDAGCGQGLNLIMAAICHPDSQFVGIDFLPEHVAHARGLAERCGLTNVEFIEGDFVSLAEDPSSLGQFDYAICHGIATWVSFDVRESLYKLIGLVLKPGGIFYNSYNTLPGWGAMIPFQHMVLLEQKNKSGAAALKAAQDSMERLNKLSNGNSLVVQAMDRRLKGMNGQDIHYLLQEYNNQTWSPCFVSDMIASMSAVKLSYLGTATLPESFDLMLPTELREWLESLDSIAMREQVRDYALNQSFRRDLYVKGQRKPWRQEKMQLFSSARFLINPMMALPAKDEPFEIKGGAVILKGKHEVYMNVINRIRDFGASGANLMEMGIADLPSAERTQFVSTLSLLMHGGFIVPFDSNALARPDLSKKLSQAVVAGAPYKYLPVPTTGGAMVLSEMDWILLGFEVEGIAKEKWVELLLSCLAGMGRALLHEGKPISDNEQERTLAQGLVNSWHQAKGPFLKQLGAF